MKLNLPEYNPQLRKTDSGLEIYDPIRKKFLILTPEEWVRQHFINYLQNTLMYSLNSISIESEIMYLGKIKRIDLCVYDAEGKPFILIECKAPYVPLSLNTISQISGYASTLSTAKYLCITNGLEHICYERTHDEFLIIKSLPSNKINY